VDGAGWRGRGDSGLKGGGGRRVAVRRGALGDISPLLLQWLSWA